MKLNENEQVYEYITAARAGSYSALEALVSYYRDYIYNLVVRFLGSSLDAEDAVQEILVKMITKLSLFRGNSSFKTWLYRITVNHVLNIKRTRQEKLFTSFEAHKEFIENLPVASLHGLSDYSEEKRCLMEEDTKIQCQIGMLLCLERENRITFILGAVMGVDSVAGAAVMEITPEAFRKRLSRSRKRLLNYMRGNCSLIHRDGTCTCRKRTESLINMGYINPDNLMFYTGHLEKVATHVRSYSEHADSMLEKRVDNAFRDHPWMKSPGYIIPLRKIIRRMESAWGESGIP